MKTSAINQPKLLKRTKRLILFFILGLIVSGVTAFPIEWELSIATDWIESLQLDNVMTRWIKLTYEGISETNAKYPFISYGTDWLAFAHLVIAIVFIGPLRNPVKNIWVIEFGIIACFAIFPLALIAGYYRGILFYWQLVDCSFGLVGGVLLFICYRRIKRLEAIQIGC
jgi:membrane associated rhomboid family serine protease